MRALNGTERAHARGRARPRALDKWTLTESLMGVEEPCMFAHGGK